MGSSFGDSFMYGALIGVGLVVIFALIGMTRQAKFTEQVRRHNVLPTSLPPEEALRRIRGLAGQGFKIAQEDPQRGLLVLSDSISLLSFGNFYPVFASEGQVTVGISPKVPQYGPVVGNKLRKITETVEGVLRV